MPLSEACHGKKRAENRRAADVVAVDCEVKRVGSGDVT